MSYENFLIREANGEDWPLDRTEATADWFDHDVNSGEDVCVPASPEIHPVEIDYEHFGAESNPYTKEESDNRLKETHLC